MNAGRTDALADAYDSWHREHSSDSGIHSQTGVFYDWILELAQPRSGERLLDVACGAGGFMQRAAGLGLDVVGLDVSPTAIELAGARLPGAELHVGEAERLPFPDSSFDLVTCLGSLEHFPRPDAGAAEMRRVLAPGGRALVFVPNLFFLGHVWFGLRHGQQPTEGGQEFSEEYLSSGGWRTLLEDSGFEILDVRPWNRIHASVRVPPLVKRVWNAGSRLVPLNGSYAFGFVCTKR
jgi:SAM-dependent methyltransferase